MTHDPKFLQDMQGVPMDPGRLETLGKDAAAFADSAGLGLSEAVVRTIGKTKLNAEQVRRVVEFTNQEAFNRKFAAMNSLHRVIDIDGGPADPARVLQDLNDGARPEATFLPSLDYLMPPAEEKTAEFDFGLGSTGRDDGLRGRTIQEIVDLRGKFASAHDEVVGIAGSAQLQMQESLDRLGEAVRVAVKTAGLVRDDLVPVWRSINADLVGTALSRVGPLPVRGHGVKTAHRINPEHPVVAEYASFAKFAESYAQADMARQDLERRLVDINSFLKQYRV
jgi:hypothetical protein